MLWHPLHHCRPPVVSSVLHPKSAVVGPAHMAPHHLVQQQWSLCANFVFERLVLSDGVHASSVSVIEVATM
jgi:hypothetical protein